MSLDILPEQVEDVLLYGALGLLGFWVGQQHGVAVVTGLIDGLLGAIPL